MKRLSQKEKVLRHLQNCKTITPLDAIHDYSITRLSAIIYTLVHEDGYIIDSKIKTGTNRFGEPCRWAEYTLIG